MLTVVALYFWPWQWSLDPKDGDEFDGDGLRKSEIEKFGEQDSEDRKSEDGDDIDEMAKSVPSIWDRIKQSIDWHNRLRRCLFLAALACVLRPTNVLIWICFACFVVLRMESHGKMLSLPWEGMQLWLVISSLSLLPATKKERLVLAREVALCGHV